MGQATVENKIGQVRTREDAMAVTEAVWATSPASKTMTLRQWQNAVIAEIEFYEKEEAAFQRGQHWQSSF